MIKKPIIILSPQHSGTHFWIHFFFKHQEMVKKYIGLTRQNAGQKLRTLNLNYSNKTLRTLMTSHLESFEDKQVIEKISTFPHMLTIREPLLNLISTLNVKRPGGDYKILYNKTKIEFMKSLLNQWVILVEYIKNHGPFEITTEIDLLKEAPIEKRIATLTKVLKFFELAHDEKLIQSYQEWPMVASMDKLQDSPIQEKYAERDVSFIKKYISNELWGYLKTYEIALRPFLESRGYENLLWWSK